MFLLLFASCCVAVHSPVRTRSRDLCAQGYPAATFGQLVANVVVREIPEIATVTRNPRKREGKVYIDYVQNGHGRLLVAPFCVRPLPAAPVSTPLRWSEVTAKLDLKDYTIATVPPRLARMKKDPWNGLLDMRPDLTGSLAHLQRWFGE